MRDTELYARIAGFDFDQGNTRLTFAQRLARDNHWLLEFAQEVIAEYLKFIYLASLRVHAVTPPVAIDQAWHLHLCYTHSYWNDLCEGILKRELHHGPTKGGRSEGAKFQNWYEKTLELYALEFGYAPPAHIWPASEIRFSPKYRPVSVTEQSHIILDRQKVTKCAVAVLVLVGGFMALGAKSENSDDVWIVILVVVVGVIILSLIFENKNKRKGRRRDDRSCGAGGCGGGGCSSSSSSGRGDSPSHHGDSGCSSSGDSGGGGSGCGGGGCGGGD